MTTRGNQSTQGKVINATAKNKKYKELDMESEEIQVPPEKLQKYQSMKVKNEQNQIEKQISSLNKSSISKNKS